MVSDAYTQRVLELLNAPDIQVFHTCWMAFHDDFHAEQSHANAFFALSKRIADQVDVETFSEFVFHFFENRQTTGALDFETHRHTADYSSYARFLISEKLVTLRDAITLSTRLAERNTEQVWQYDKLLNEMLWQVRDSTAFIKRIETVYANHGPHSVHCCSRTDLPQPLSGSSENSRESSLEHVLPALLSEPSDGGPKCAWHTWSQGYAVQDGALRLDHPFSIDCNHHDEMGIFFMLLGCTFVDGEQRLAPASLDGVGLEVRVSYADAASSEWTLHVGTYTYEDPATPEPAGQSSYWVHDTPIEPSADASFKLDLRPTASSWSWMGRNPKSAPYHSYCHLPLEHTLSNASGLFFLMRPKVRFRLPRISIHIGSIKFVR